MSAASLSDSLDAGNQAFHDAYGEARDGVREQVPILVVLSSDLALHQRGQRHGAAYSRPSFALAKAAAHIAVALYALTCPESSAERRSVGVARLLTHIEAALAAPARADPVTHDITALLELCARFAHVAREKAPLESVRNDFASKAGPRILQITELATGEQIAGLHEAVERTLGLLSAREQAELQIVVVGDHQARARSLGMQYFKRRFQEEPGADERITYGENISEEAEAISLVATRRLDKRIAQAFFGDEARLERDVLGDAAKRCLDQMRFPTER